MKGNKIMGRHNPVDQRKMATIAISLTVLLMMVGCASTKISDREQLIFADIPRPGNILVYDFAASADDLPVNSTLYSHPNLNDSQLTPEQYQEGKKLGALIASNLVENILELGMPAQVATARTKPQLNDLVLRGYLVSINQGSEAQRVAIGFGKGASELKTAVEGFQMTSNGLRKLGAGDLDASGSKTPGGAVGLAALIATHNPAGLIVSSGIHLYGEETGSSKVQGRAKQTAKEISDVLKKRFQEQGWID